MAERLLAETRWAELPAGGRHGEDVAADLALMLFDPGDEVGAAYSRLENDLVSQHDLFEVTPAAVAVIAAALSEGSVPPRNLGCVLDQLLRILSGSPAPNQVALGRLDLHGVCWPRRSGPTGPSCATRPRRRTREHGRDAAECVQAMDEIPAFRFPGWGPPDADGWPDPDAGSRLSVPLGA